MPARIVMDPVTANVDPTELLAQLADNLEDKGKITTMAWNDAVRALAETGKSKP